jgi:protein gp37
MARETAISWTDHTHNHWRGCTKVSDACGHCYAEELIKRFPQLAKGWGPGVPRTLASQHTRDEPLRWDRQAQTTGKRPRVFAASLSDVFDNEVPSEWRDELWQVIRATPNLRWMLLTKRIGNAPKMLPLDWPYQHVGLMATLENQAVFDRDWPKFARIPAAWRGVSMEPLLGPIELGDARPDWVIVGGESGSKHRPPDVAWIRSLRDQCLAANIRFHFKQHGGRYPDSNGCLLDGREWKQYPAAHDDGVDEGH